MKFYLITSNFSIQHPNCSGSVIFKICVMGYHDDSNTLIPI